MPCMDAGATPVESVQIVKEALAAGIPVAAQNGGVFLLAMAGGLKGRNFAIYGPLRLRVIGGFFGLL